jgi:hypothetical protein
MGVSGFGSKAANPTPPSPLFAAGFTGMLVSSGGVSSTARRLLQLNNAQVNVTGYFNIGQELDLLAHEYNLTQTQIAANFKNWQLQYAQCEPAFGPFPRGPSPGDPPGAWAR